MFLNACAIKGRGRLGRPSQKELNNLVVEAVAVEWKNLGFQLLNNESALKIIDADHNKEVSLRACRFTLIQCMYKLYNVLL